MSIVNLERPPRFWAGVVFLQLRGTRELGDCLGYWLLMIFFIFRNLREMFFYFVTLNFLKRKMLIFVVTHKGILSTCVMLPGVSEPSLTKFFVPCMFIFNRCCAL